MEVKSDVVDTKEKPWWPPGSKCQCKKRIKYIQPQIPKSFKPNLVYNPEGNPPVSGDTIYKKSYKDFDINELKKCQGKPFKPQTYLTSAGDFQSDTTNKMSYGPWEKYKKRNALLPKDHCLLGNGPMQEMTTNRHDYTPKGSYADKPEKIIRPGCLGMSDQPLEKKTTNNLSYLWPDNIEQTGSFKPEASYRPPVNKMEDETTQKLSYQPWDNNALRRKKYPWQEKGKYVTPSIPMHGETIYNNSYFAPGKFAEGDSVEGCYCKFVGQCFDKEGEPPKAHEYKVCPIGYDPRTNGNTRNDQNGNAASHNVSNKPLQVDAEIITAPPTPPPSTPPRPQTPSPPQTPPPPQTNCADVCCPANKMDCRPCCCGC